LARETTDRWQQLAEKRLNRQIVFAWLEDGGFGVRGPEERLQPGWVVEVTIPDRSADELDARARGAEPPVIGYIREGRLRLDVRTLSDDEIREAAEALGRAW